MMHDSELILSASKLICSAYAKFIVFYFYL